MKALIVKGLKSAGLYNAAKAPFVWYARGRESLAAAKSRKRMQEFYPQFFAKGDLCYDVGANVGNRTEIFLELGATVVCLEPQHACCEHLRKLFGQRPDVVIIEKAVGDHEGTAALAVCDEAPTLSTLSDKWTTEGRFAKDFHWTRTEKVPLTTLDALIAEYGTPRFCKIDVEGFEVQVLRGLSRPIPFISFEFCSEFLENARRCSNHLLSTGLYDFQVSLGERMDFLFHEWVGAAELYERIESLSEDLQWGDIYARHV